MLSLKNLIIQQAGVALVCAIDMELEEGTALIVKGANGMGKTTLLKTLAGLIIPQSGAVLWQGKPIGAALEEYRANVHYLGHRNGLSPELTLLENLSCYAHLHDKMELLEVAISYFGLYPYVYMPCSKLSAGTLRKAALAHLMLARKKIWLLDEPTSNLDKLACEGLQHLINTRIEQRGIVVMTSHQGLDIPNAMEIELQPHPSRMQAAEPVHA